MAGTNSRVSTSGRALAYGKLKRMTQKKKIPTLHVGVHLRKGSTLKIVK